MTVTFKNVGQGDCIIIEWVADQSRQVGVVDCCHSVPNAAISHIQQGDYSSLEFVVLSHPHRDHHSGVEELLLFCEQHNINIRYFFHTCDVVPDRLRAAVVTKQDRKRLGRLFQTMDRLNQTGIIGKIIIVSDMIKPFPLSSTICLEFLGPANEESVKYIPTAFAFDVDLSTGNNPAANWLSTILMLRKDDQYILLTGDAKREAMKRVYYDRLKDSRRTMVGGQAPHHGSGTNHFPLLWKKCKGEHPRAVISVGRNSYGHPSPNTISSLRTIGYDVKCTGRIVGWREPTKRQKALAGISKPSRAYFSGGGSDVRLTL